MTEMKKRMKAVFSDYKKFIAALKGLAKKPGLDMEVFSPMPLHEVEDILPQKPSPVRWFTFLGGVLGLTFEEPEAAVEDEMKGEIENLIEERAAARKEKNWQLADDIRNKLDEMGIILEDGPTGTTWKQKR